MKKISIGLGLLVAFPRVAARRKSNLLSRQRFPLDEPEFHLIDNKMIEDQSLLEK